MDEGSVTTVEEDPTIQKLPRVVTPLPAPKMMDLPQFKGEHEESLYWGTYRPLVYLGIRARTPKSLVAGLMWNGLKNGQYHLRHVCQDSDDLSTYGWTDHNGRDYGRQLLKDHGLSLTTTFLKEKSTESGYGGDWAVRFEEQNDMLTSGLVITEDSASHFFFYVVDEEGNSLGLSSQLSEVKGTRNLAYGARSDIGCWELHLESQEHLEVHFSGFRTFDINNLTDLVLDTLDARKTGQLQLPDTFEDSSNLIVFQISARLPAKVDIAFVSGTGLENSRVKERVNNLTGDQLTATLEKKQKEFDEKFTRCFNLDNKVDSKEMFVGKTALANMLGGIGYFYGQSKIALPKDFTQNNEDKFIHYWPAALFTSVPGRSVFPRGFLWDEGFHQLIIWRWDFNISMDIIGHWLDLINIDGWIPREQILGTEALSKVPEEYISQHPTDGNPPTFFLVLRDMLNSVKRSQITSEASHDISVFIDRAYNRFNAWFQWFNVTQAGKATDSFYWHGRNNTTNKQLNPQTLMSGLDDYPRASHPTDDERHLDLRCWMLLAADCMHSIDELLGTKHGSENDFLLISKRLSNFENLNQMHLDDSSGVYFDFGNHTEKVHLRWHDVMSQGAVQRELIRETLEKPQLSLVPHLGYVSLFPFMMGIIPSDSWILGKQLEFISNHSTLWTEYGIRSLSKTSSIYMKYNTEHEAPYWRGSIWVNMNYMILSALHHYSQEDGPYKDRAGELYVQLRSNLIRNIVVNYYEKGYLFEQYDQEDQGKGKGVRPFTGWTALVLLLMAEDYPSLHR